jgi:hypothetical protein
LAIRDRFTTDAPIAAGADRVAIAAITASPPTDRKSTRLNSSH